MERAPDLTLSIRDGGFVSILKSDVVLKPRPEVVGTHRPEGIFMAKGPGIRRGLLSAWPLDHRCGTHTLVYPGSAGSAGSGRARR